MDIIMSTYISLALLALFGYGLPRTIDLISKPNQHFPAYFQKAEECSRKDDEQKYSKYNGKSNIHICNFIMEEPH